MAPSLLETHPEIAGQWHPDRNAEMGGPESVTYGSAKTPWWVCDRGHDYQARVNHRTTSGSGCPVCAGKQVVAGVNDLASQHPDVAAQWHPTRNDSLVPRALAPGTNRKAWWLCPSGHEYRASVKHRTGNGSGCPVCAGHQVVAGVNDLASQHPEIAGEWHPTKNAISPDSVASGSDICPWWLCAEGHDFRAPVVRRTARQSGCPYCCGARVLPGFNDLATTHPRLAAEWGGSKNTLAASRVMAGSASSVWWTCHLGHDYEATPNNRSSRGSGCPYCSGQRVLAGFNDVASTHPDIAAEWHPTLNGGLAPSDVTQGTARKVWWLCPDGHTFDQAVFNRCGNKQSCPECGLYATSKQEIAIRRWLSDHLPIEDPPRIEHPDVDRWLMPDIWVPDLGLAIEYDGSHWHRDTEDRDRLRIAQYADLGVKLVRVREHPLDIVGPHDLIVDRVTPRNIERIAKEVLEHVCGPNTSGHRVDHR